MKKLILVLAVCLIAFSMMSCESQNNQSSLNNQDSQNNQGSLNNQDSQNNQGSQTGNNNDTTYLGLEFYPLDDGTYVVSGEKAKYLKTISIPSIYRGGKVVAIENSAFKDCTLLEEITIPDTITRIEENAFSGCTSLKEITIPNSVTELGKGAFTGCSALTKISMPCYKTSKSYIWLCVDASVKSISSQEYIDFPPVETINITGGDAIPEEMFYISCRGESDFQSTLKSIMLPDTLTSIGEAAFASCPEIIFEEENGIKYLDNWAIGCTKFDFSLRNDTVGIASMALIFSYNENEFDKNDSTFTIPASVKHLSPAALIVSPYTTRYYVDASNTAFCAVDGIVYSKDMKTLIQYPPAREEDVFSIPEGVINVHPYAFYGSKVKSITIPSTMTKISNRAFSYCMMENITIPSTITKIEAQAFWYCFNLIKVVIPDSVTSIGTLAFGSCGIKSIYYTGSEKDWNNIDIASVEPPLAYDDPFYFDIITIYYDYAPTK